MTLAAKMAQAEVAHACVLICDELPDLIDRHFGDVRLTWHGFLLDRFTLGTSDEVLSGYGYFTPPIDRWLTDLENAPRAAR